MQYSKIFATLTLLASSVVAQQCTLPIGCDNSGFTIEVWENAWSLTNPGHAGMSFRDVEKREPVYETNGTDAMWLDGTTVLTGRPKTMKSVWGSPLIDVQRFGQRISGFILFEKKETCDLMVTGPDDAAEIAFGYNYLHKASKSTKSGLAVVLEARWQSGTSTGQTVHKATVEVPAGVIAPFAEFHANAGGQSKNYFTIRCGGVDIIKNSKIISPNRVIRAPCGDANAEYIFRGLAGSE